MERILKSYFIVCVFLFFFFFSSRRRHTRLVSDWSSDVCSSDLSSLGRDRGSIDPLPRTRLSRLRRVFACVLPVFCESRIVCRLRQDRPARQCIFSTLPADVSLEVREFREFAVPRPRYAISEEHTSELQSLTNLVCRLLLEKKKKT